MTSGLNNFQINKITDPSEEVAVQLKREREGKGISLKEAAEKLDINIRYLAAFEEGQWESLPRGLYGKKFLRRYAEFLNLDAKELISLYSRSVRGISSHPVDLFTPKVPKVPIVLPKLIKNIIIIFFVLLCLGYLGYYVNNITKPPKLVITQPAEDITTSKNYIIVRGLAEAETDITINGEKILLKEGGGFSKEINLKEGINTIAVIAQKKYSRKNIITRRVLLKKIEN